ncbi:MAG: AraC family transcriptional regulator [Pseudomonadota bacterium]
MTLPVKTMTSVEYASTDLNEPTVASGIVSGFVEFAVSNGANRHHLIANAGIDVGWLLDRDSRVPVSRYVKMLESARQECKDPAIALKFGERYSLAELSIVALVCETCATAAEALLQMNRLSRLLIDDNDRGPAERLAIEHKSGEVWMVLTCDKSVDHPLITESAFARIVCSFDRLLGSRECVREVHFAHGEPTYSDEHQRVFGVPVRFGTDKNAIRIDAAALSAPLPPSDPFAFGVLSDRATHLLAALKRAQTFRAQVEHKIMLTLHMGQPTIEKVSAGMGVSVQILARRLADENITFEVLLDELRHQLALNYLSDGKVSVKETAYLLGYSEASSFSRAFKRWTGTAPSKRRELPD